ncbi:hypothetical protein PQX77_003737 [Marasmius sp. AFHP31]|nr:hypothetical protein PQX77_003737 [Marasmius sp. AFHP31]
MSLALLPVCLANVAIESLLYGIFFILNAVSLLLALQTLPRYQPSTGLRPMSSLKRVVSVLKKPMFVGSAPLFITVTAHWICTVLRSFEAFISFKNGTEPTIYYLDVSQPTYIAKSGLMFASVIISDSMMVYRLWVVWNYNYRIAVLPFLNILAFVACGVGTTRLYAVAPSGMALIHYQEATSWVIADVVLSVFTNTYSTSMYPPPTALTTIYWPLRSPRSSFDCIPYMGHPPNQPRPRKTFHDRLNKHHGSSSQPNEGTTPLLTIVFASPDLQAALAMFVESAVLFSAWVLFFTSLYAAKSSLESLAEDNIAVMAGIAFSLINVRIGLRRSKSMSAQSTTVATQHSNRPLGTGDVEDLAYPMRPMSVHVHQVKTVTSSTPDDTDSMKVVALDVDLKDDTMSNRPSVDV